MHISSSATRSSFYFFARWNQLETYFDPFSSLLGLCLQENADYYQREAARVFSHTKTVVAAAAITARKICKRRRARQDPATVFHEIMLLACCLLHHTLGIFFRTSVCTLTAQFFFASRVPVMIGSTSYMLLLLLC